MSTELRYTGTTENKKGPVYEFQAGDYEYTNEEETEISVNEMLKDEANIEVKEAIPEKSIYWLDDSFWDSWDKVKGRMKKLLGHKEEYDSADNKLFFLAHSNDTLIGRPQLIDQTQKTIPLLRVAIKRIKNRKNEEGIVPLADFTDIKSVFTLEERFDKRVDGYQKEILTEDFRIYRVIDKNDMETYLFSKEKLPNCSCVFKGMNIEMEDFAEMSRNLKVKSISKVFLVKEFEPSVKLLPPEDIVKFTKERGINLQTWFDFLNYHELGTINEHVPEWNRLKSAWLVAGKKDGTHLHLFKMGPPGTKKSMGDLETTNLKFSEENMILEGGNSRIKMLTPSFKEKPANLGYLAKAERVGLIDEVGKMIEFELNKHQSAVQNIMGELNMLYDNKKRLVGSGNDNECEVQSTSKNLIVTNPVSSRATIYSHVGLIDPTWLSRNLVWVQDYEEQEFVMSEKSVREIPPTPKNTDRKKNERGILINNDKIPGVFLYVGGNSNSFSSREEFLTLFDSITNFTCEIDTERVNKLVSEITLLAKEPMKSSVWKPRAKHHVYLLIDGLVKLRCLFQDYDPTFTPKQEDYDWAERILVRMVKSWDTNLQPKEDFQ